MKIKKLTLSASDIHEQLEFYTEILGFEGSLVNNEAQIQIGETLVVFTSDTSNNLSSYHFAMNIPENKFDEATEWLAERCTLIADNEGEEIFNFENWNSHSVYTYDPNGNIIELIARHDLENKSEEDFDVTQILNVSEIGIAVDNIAKTLSDFEKLYSLSIYKETQNETFSALGDEHGLFILVQEGREWFPDTEVAAEQLPLEVEFENSSGSTFVFKA